MENWYYIEFKGIYVGKVFCHKQDLINEFNKQFMYEIQGNLFKVFGKIGKRWRQSILKIIY